MPLPLVSVILPVFNQKKEYLEKSIKSILEQTFADFELLIIDDGSTDHDCLETLKRCSEKDQRIKIIKNGTNSGIIYSLNHGLEESKGTFIARMDSDDIAFPERLQKQLAFLKKHPGYDLIGSWAVVIDETDKEMGSIQFPADYETIKKTILYRNPIMHPTWMFRRSLIESVGKYDKTAINAEDYEFLLRIARNHRIANIPEVLLKYRFNTHGLSFGKNKIQEKNAIKIRFRALKRYDYPLWQAFYLIYPATLYFLVPSFLKKLLIRLSYKKI